MRCISATLLRSFGAFSAAVLVVSTLTAASTKFKSTWKAPGLEPVSWAGKKVVALVISDDDSLRVSSEEGLSSELTDRGMVGVPSYRIIPKPEVKDPDKARGWFERAQAEGVVAMRLVDARKVQTYTPGTWTGPYYGSLWGYYGYGWGSGMYIPPRVDEDALVTIETLIFSVPQNKLLWAGVSESKNPKGARQLIADLVKVTAKELQKQGLAKPRK
jgi:hypothetical protein